MVHDAGDASAYDSRLETPSGVIQSTECPHGSLYQLAVIQRLCGMKPMGANNTASASLAVLIVLSAVPIVLYVLAVLVLPLVANGFK